jgi:hypothetical protein
MRQNAALMVLLTGLALPASGQTLPQRVPPPDSEEYCQVLLERLSVARSTGNATAVAQLTQDGQELCANGFPRRGIAKLRRALRLALTEGQG